MANSNRAWAVRFGAQQAAEGGQVIEADNVLGMIGSGHALAAMGVAQVQKRPDAHQKMVGLQIASILQERGVDFMAVEEPFAAQRPNAGQENPQALMLEVEPFHLVPPGGRAFPLAFPKPLHVQELFERIEGCPNPLPKHIRQAGRVINRPHVQERIELFAFQRRHVVQIETAAD